MSEVRAGYPSRHLPAKKIKFKLTNEPDDHDSQEHSETKKVFYFSIVHTEFMSEAIKVAVNCLFRKCQETS